MGLSAYSLRAEFWLLFMEKQDSIYFRVFFGILLLIKPSFQMIVDDLGD